MSAADVFDVDLDWSCEIPAIVGSGGVALRAALIRDLTRLIENYGGTVTGQITTVAVRS